MNLEEREYSAFGRSLVADNGSVQLVIPLEYGIRIGHFSFVGGENVFYEQPSDMKELTTEDGWRLRGGHRLWLAPENEDTYCPDNAPVTYEVCGEEILLTQALDERLGVVKSLRISFVEDASVRLTHRIVNCNPHAITRSLWAISVMAPGGTEDIPLGQREGGMSHWHRISWWDHTSLGDERATYEKERIVIRHLPIDKRYKIGVGHPAGPVRYVNRGVIFEKSYDFKKEAVYPDGDVSFESFFCRHMAEIESLSPLYTVAPGESAEHQETWKLFRAE
ncbi:MAG: hypothetical protein IKJ35_09195 [Clostridia bacterium]|nr:hypothetical protein [Clostridia bacterium]